MCVLFNWSMPGEEEYLAAGNNTVINDNYMTALNACTKIYFKSKLFLLGMLF